MDSPAARPLSDLRKDYSQRVLDESSCPDDPMALFALWFDEALDAMQRAVAIDRSISYAHALGHDLVALSDVHLLRHERAEARVALQEALIWFEYTDDADAAASARLRLDTPEGDPAPLAWAPDRSVRSHLHLPEGKVYCAFESPLAAGSRPAG